MATAVAGLSLSAVRELSVEISGASTSGDTRARPQSATTGTNWTSLPETNYGLPTGRVRAILHAAFTLSLAQYCFDRDFPHPGFVVLDSPLVTYRPQIIRPTKMRSHRRCRSGLLP